MKLIINGDLNEYYVQTLCLLFFPGEKFSKTEPDAPDAPIAELTVDGTQNAASATVTLTYRGKSVTKSAEGVATGESFMADAKRIAAGKAFFAAGKSLLGITAQWGILTGVRPSKIALRALNGGKTKLETKTRLAKELILSPKKAALVTDIAAIERKIIATLPPKSCSVYVSIPFCPSRCSYCSFVSCTSPKLLALLDDYLIKLCRDIDECFDNIYELGMSVSTLYIGGGTPTTLNAAQLKILLSKLSSRVDVSSLREFTVEAGRPDTVTAEKLALLREFGVTRVSINPQTLNDDILEAIGRKHTTEQFYYAYDLARKSGIKCINTDLIAGLPGEGFGSFSETVDKIIALKPENLTVHTLCIKSAADFAHDAKNKVNDNGDTSKCIDYSQISAKNAGYIPYYIYRQKNAVSNLENVGFAFPGTEGLYNIFMMEEIHSIFAVGAGAVTKLVSPDRNHIERIFEFKYPYEYLTKEDPEKRAEKRTKIFEFFNTYGI
ncbi:MAG: coproporphyrinogen dehydrogenase HemZ [Clostridia bacterium]|nr:coproporphyrinogen dehydrogenase HemZ [Clostridia bacterium]